MSKPSQPSNIAHHTAGRKVCPAHRLRLCRHDFGSFEIDGHKFFFKIDYYHPTLEHGSRGPSRPANGFKQLLTQLLGFGGEKHDDAVDALVYLILGLADDGIEEQRVRFLARHGFVIHACPTSAPHHKPLTVHAVTLHTNIAVLSIHSAIFYDHRRAMDLNEIGERLVPGLHVINLLRGQ